MDALGVPAAVICTEEFIPTARAQAAISGNPDYPLPSFPTRWGA